MISEDDLIAKLNRGLAEPVEPPADFVQSLLDRLADDEAAAPDADDHRGAGGPSDEPVAADEDGPVVDVVDLSARRSNRLGPRPSGRWLVAAAAVLLIGAVGVGLTRTPGVNVASPSPTVTGSSSGRPAVSSASSTSTPPSSSVEAEPSSGPEAEPAADGDDEDGVSPDLPSSSASGSSGGSSAAALSTQSAEPSPARPSAADRRCAMAIGATSCVVSQSTIGFTVWLGAGEAGAFDSGLIAARYESSSADEAVVRGLAVEIDDSDVGCRWDATEGDSAVLVDPETDEVYLLSVSGIGDDRFRLRVAKSPVFDGEQLVERGALIDGCLLLEEDEG